MGTTLQDNVLVVPAVKYQNLHFAVITPLLLATLHSKANEFNENSMDQIETPKFGFLYVLVQGAMHRFVAGI